MRHLLGLGALALSLACGACGPGSAPAASDANATAGEGERVAAPDLRRCKPAPGTTGSPKTIDEAVALVNGLPFPVSAECLIEALDRPLQVEASKSTASVQKALGERSPRIFVWPDDQLVMTIVVDGPTRDLVELGQFVTPRRSVKAEIAFPLEAPTTTAAALERVRNPEHPRITSCFVCHDREVDEPSVPGGRSSLALRPRKGTLVDLAGLRAEHERCDREAEPARCAWLAALFAHGPVEHRAFDAELAIF
ncbi:MAG: hypothetical protein KC420_08030 [Myxococcales bacterium]|nr:hypothetical protein [Myxococcales bacterium]